MTKRLDERLSTYTHSRSSCNVIQQYSLTTWRCITLWLRWSSSTASVTPIFNTPLISGSNLTKSWVHACHTGVPPFDVPTGVLMSEFWIEIGSLCQLILHSKHYTTFNFNTELSTRIKCLNFQAWWSQVLECCVYTLDYVHHNWRAINQVL